MKKLIKQFGRLNVWILILLMAVCAAGCGEDNDSPLSPDNDGQNTGKGSVTITNIVAKKKTTTGYQIEVTVKTSGVTSDEVEMLSCKGGTSQNAEGTLWASLGGGRTSGTMKIVSGLRGKTTYYVKAYMQTETGTVYSSIKNVTTP